MTLLPQPDGATIKDSVTHLGRPNERGDFVVGLATGVLLFLTVDADSGMVHVVSQLQLKVSIRDEVMKIELQCLEYLPVSRGIRPSKGCLS